MTKTLNVYINKSPKNNTTPNKAKIVIRRGIEIFLKANVGILLISKVPTFAFKKISIPRRMTIFALFGVVLFFGLLLIYTFKVLVICGLIYVCLIPIGYFSYQKIYKQKILIDENDTNEDLEDIL